MRNRYPLYLLIVIGLTLTCMMTACQTLAASVPPVEVIHEARHFIPNAVFKKTVETKKGTYYEFGHKNQRVLVDAKTGKVNDFTWPYPLAKGKNHIDRKTAESRIRTWLKDRGIDLTRWTLFDKKTIYESNYNFFFGKKTSDGIILNSHLYIVMRSDGKLLDYSYSNNPITISLKPNFTKQELIDIAFKNVKLKNAKIKSFNISVADRFDNIDKQMLLATIWFKGDSKIPESSEVGIIINAHTGEVITLMGKAGK